MRTRKRLNPTREDSTQVFNLFCFAKGYQALHDRQQVVRAMVHLVHQEVEALLTLALFSDIQLNADQAVGLAVRSPHYLRADLEPAHVPVWPEVAEHEIQELIFALKSPLPS